MAETQEKAPKAEEKTTKAEGKRELSYTEQMAEINRQAFYIEAARRTGWTLAEAEKNVTRLTEEGDYFDERGRWTLDVAGYPVCHEGWKPEPLPELP